MKTYIKIALFGLLGSTIMSSAAKADLYIEPYIGYELGKIKDSGTTTSPVASTIDASGNLNGSDLGLKLGYKFLMLVVGADYMSGSLTDKQTTNTTISGTTTSADNTGTDKLTDIGAFVSVRLPLVAVSATYFLSAKNKGSGGDTASGNGLKIGASFTGFPIISVNLDFITENYNKVDSSSTTFTDFKMTRTSEILSVSVPLSF